MDNYPPGAANDKLAPYNQPLDDQVEVLVRETLERECVLEIPVHKYQLRHYDEDLPEYYENQEFTLHQQLFIVRCMLEALIKEGCKNVGGYSVSSMVELLKEWQPVSNEVTEK